MMGTKIITQLHNLTPDQLSEILQKEISKQFDDFKKENALTNKETYLTRSQTAQMLSISLTCLNDWSKKQILRPLKLGNRTYYRLSQIEAKLNR